MILNATDIAVLPYTSITNSAALKTLLAYQIPTIASDLDVFREINEQYHSLELFKNNDVNDLCAKIVELINDEERIGGLIEGAKKIWNDTKLSSIAQKHLQLYYEVIASHPDSIYFEKDSMSGSIGLSVTRLKSY